MNGLLRHWPICLLWLALMAPGAPLVLAYAPEPWLALVVFFLVGAVAVWKVTELPQPLRPWMKTLWPWSLLTMAWSWTALAGEGWLPGVGPVPLAPVAAGGIVALMLRISGHDMVRVNMFFLMVALCVPAWLGRVELAWGLLVLAVVIGLAQTRLRSWQVAGLTLALGLLSGLVPWGLHLPLVAGLGLLAVWPRRALGVMVAGETLAVLLWMIRGSGLEVGLSSMEMGFAGVALLCVAALMVYHWRWWSVPVQVVWGLGVPLALWGLTEMDMGAALPVVPVLVYVLLSRITHEGRARRL